MLVKFIDNDNPTIILEKDYPDILPLLEMIKQKATINLFLDQDGIKRVNGRLYDFEYTISVDNEEINDNLLIKLDCYFSNVNN